MRGGETDIVVPPFGRERAGGACSLLLQSKGENAKIESIHTEEFREGYKKNPQKSPGLSPLNQPDMLQGLLLQSALALQP